LNAVLIGRTVAREGIRTRNTPRQENVKPHGEKRKKRKKKECVYELDKREMYSTTVEGGEGVTVVTVWDSGVRLNVPCGKVAYLIITF
jgi:hypothetical protein